VSDEGDACYKPAVFVRRPQCGIAAALQKLEHQAVLDGEVVVLDEKGYPSFEASLTASYPPEFSPSTGRGSSVRGFNGRTSSKECPFNQ